MKRFVGPLLILLCTVIWGSAFIAQKLGADHYGPFAITCYRNVLGGLFLWFCIRIRDRRGRCGAPPRPGTLGAQAVGRSSDRMILLGGAASGVCLFLAMVSQQLGIESTTPGISAFLTANYVLLVPVFAWIIGRGRPGFAIWLGVALALLGTCFICFADFSAQLSSFKVGPGEAWTLLCAALFAVQIMVVDRFAHDVDVVRFSMVQLFVAALCALPFVFLPSELAGELAGLRRGPSGTPFRRRPFERHRLHAAEPWPGENAAGARGDHHVDGKRFRGPLRLADPPRPDDAAPAHRLRPRLSRRLGFAAVAA